jgi:hypothetical protein
MVVPLFAVPTADDPATTLRGDHSSHSVMKVSLAWTWASYACGRN